MISENEVLKIAGLADITLKNEELKEFTDQFNTILDYFDLLDQEMEETAKIPDLYNVLREDEEIPMLPQEDVLANAGAKEDGFIKAPRVM